MKKYLLFTILLLVFMLVDCKKEDDETPDDNNISLDLQATKTNVFPLELVTVTGANIQFTEDSYLADINEINVPIQRVNDTLLLFIMPDKLTGQQTLNININGSLQPLQFNVKQKQNIEDPETYINQFVEQFYLFGNDPTSLEIMSEFDNALDDFNALSSEDKVQAADFVAANSEILIEVNDILSDHSKSDDSTESLKSTCSNEVYRSNKMKCLVADYLLCVAKLAIPVVAGSVLGTGVTPAGSFVGGMVGVLVVNICMKSTMQRSAELWGDLTTLVFQPIQSFLGFDKSQTFYNGLSNDVQFTMAVTNVQNKTYSQDWLNNLIIKFNRFIDMWTLFMGAENTPEFPEVMQETVYSDNFDFVSLDILNNTSVTGELGGSVDNLRLSFSTTSSEDQEFDFLLIYDDTEFEISTATVSATLIADTESYSIEIYSGDEQTGEFGSTLDDSVEIIVTDGLGNPVENTLVEFVVTEGSISTTQINTDVDGIASTVWTLGDRSTIQNLEVSAYKADGETHIQGSPLTVTASCTCATYFFGGYEVVDIGTQTWMTQNMNAPSGTYVPSDEDWSNLEPEDLAWSNGTYGAYYTWKAALNVCPEGFHLPTIQEWNTLVDFLANPEYYLAGGKLKETGTTHWNSPNYAATNERCFTALPSGKRWYWDGTFRYIGERGAFWTATTHDYIENSSYLFNLFYDHGSATTDGSVGWDNGVCVRCIKD